MKLHIALGFLVLINLSLTFAQNTVVVGDSAHQRIVRQAGDETVDEPVKPKVKNVLSFKEMQKKYNLADPVSEDYPIIFNIILFISIVLVLAVIAICVFISTMDPGRDSLIYRVTSGQKYKKDN